MHGATRRCSPPTTVALEYFGSVSCVKPPRPQATRARRLENRPSESPSIVRSPLAAAKVVPKSGTLIFCLIVPPAVNEEGSSGHLVLLLSCVMGPRRVMRPFGGSWAHIRGSSRPTRVYGLCIRRSFLAWAPSPYGWTEMTPHSLVGDAVAVSRPWALETVLTHSLTYINLTFICII